MQADQSQNIFILLLIAVITGFLLPTLSKTFEIIFTRKVERQTEIRNRQLEIIEAFTKIIWEWRFLGKQVCYYGCNYKKPVNSDERFRLAISEYEERVWTIFTDIKAIKSKSMVWFEPSVSDEIEELYEYIKSDVDVKLSNLMYQSQTSNSNLENDFIQLSAQFTDEVSSKIEQHIKAIAGTINKPR
jgi:hypothetical protein